MDDSRTKRATISIRTSEANKDTLTQAAEAHGRSLNQEIEARLEASLMREQEAGSREAAIFADFVRLAASIIERQTGKRWTQDADTFFQLSKAVRSFMAANHPPASKEMEEAEGALAELSELQTPDTHEATMNALLGGNPAEVEAAMARAATIEKALEPISRYRAKMEENEEEGRKLAASLGGIFRLQTVEQPQQQARVSAGKRMAPRSMTIPKRTEPHSLRQKA